ncbi:MAG: CS domain-containing protein [Methanoregula sp.]
MQNNPNNPYDDVFNNLAKIVEDIVKNMPDSEHARIVGYTIISRSPQNGEPGIFRGEIPEDDGEIPYEITESEDQIFITAEMPATIKNAPVVDIEPERVQITADDRTTTIMLEHKVDRIHSYYRVHRSVMDITLKKDLSSNL